MMFFWPWRRCALSWVLVVYVLIPDSYTLIAVNQFVLQAEFKPEICSLMNKGKCHLQAKCSETIITRPKRITCSHEQLSFNINLPSSAFTLQCRVTTKTLVPSIHEDSEDLVLFAEGFVTSASTTIERRWKDFKKLKARAIFAAGFSGTSFPATLDNPQTSLWTVFTALNFW